MKNHWFSKQNCDFEGWERREPTYRHTDTRINGLESRRTWLFRGFGEKGGEGGGGDGGSDTCVADMSLSI